MRRPTEMCVASRYSLEKELMLGVGHFMMLEDPVIFNNLLESAIETCVSRKTANRMK